MNKGTYQTTPSGKGDQIADKPSAQPAVVAGVWTHAGTHAVVIVRLAGGARVVDARSFGAADTAAAKKFVLEKKAELVVRVAPSDQTLVQAAALDTGASTGVASSVDQSLSAARLFAEASMPAALPGHRRAAAAVASGLGDSRVCAFAIGWAVARSPDAKALAPIAPHVPERWTTPEASVLALLQDPTKPFALADADAGVVSVVALGASPPRARTLVEEVDPAQWPRAVAGVAGSVAGAAFGKACEDALVRAGESVSHVLVGVEDARGTFGPAAMQSDEGWWNTFAIPLGACILLASPGADSGVAGLADLASLHAEEPVPSPSAHERAVAWLSRGKHAAWVAGACAVLAIALPFSLAWARHATLVKKAPSTKATAANDAKSLAELAATYDYLDARRLPMTKLLADASGAAPVGVTVEKLRLSADQGLSMIGTATSTDLVNQLQKQLQDTRVFKSVNLSRQSSKADGSVSFELSAKVDAAHTVAKSDEDFAATPLAVRLHGEGATNSSPPVGAVLTSVTKKSSAGGASSPSSSADKPGSQASPGAKDTDRPARRGGSTPEDPPPAAVTDEEIAKMDSGTAMRGWISRKSYVQKHPDLDTETKDRLKTEEQKIRERHDQLKSKPAEKAPDKPGDKPAEPKGGGR